MENLNIWAQTHYLLNKNKRQFVGKFYVKEDLKNAESSNFFLFQCALEFLNIFSVR